MEGESVEWETESAKQWLNTSRIDSALHSCFQNRHSTHPPTSLTSMHSAPTATKNLNVIFVWHQLRNTLERRENSNRAKALCVIDVIIAKISARYFDISYNDHNNNAVLNSGHFLLCLRSFQSPVIRHCYAQLLTKYRAEIFGMMTSILHSSRNYFWKSTRYKNLHSILLKLKSVFVRSGADSAPNIFVPWSTEWSTLQNAGVGSGVHSAKTRRGRNTG